MKTNVKDKILYVAKTGGLKFVSSDVWVNPASDMAKNMVLRQSEELKGTSVNVVLEDGKYLSVAVLSEMQGEPVKVTEEDFDSAIKISNTLKSNIDKKYIINLQGKEFITAEGLLLMAHDIGLQSIETELIQNNPEMYIFKSTATDKNGRSFSGYGDANKLNVNSSIGKHMLRMAETRAINRSLRLLTGVGMCSADELGGDDKK